MKNFRQILASFLLLICCPILSGQQPVKIRLLDQTTGNPLQGAGFNYDTQSGVSDENGYISINFSKGSDLRVSHVAYGNRLIKDAEVEQSLRTGVFRMVPEVVGLYPVTIIALRSKKSEPGTYELNYEDKMFHDAGSILSRTPAISGIRKGGNYGFDPVLRGFKYDQLNIVVNGTQAATAACPNRMDPPASHIASNMIDHVEILKGPHSLRYGNSFGGTINFVQADPVFSALTQPYGRASTGFESNGQIFRNEGLAGIRNKRIDFGLYGSWSQGNDYTDGNGEKVQADFRRGSAGANFAIKLSGQQKATFSTIRDFAHDADFPSLMMDLRKDDTWMLNARHEYLPDSGSLRSWTTTMYITTVDHLMDNKIKTIEPRTMNTTTNAATKTFGGRTEGSWDLRNGALFAGADLRIEQASGIRDREFLTGANAGKTVSDNAWQDGKISKTALFSEYHIQMERIQLVFSGRMEMNVSGISFPMNEFTNVNQKTAITQFNPGISAGGILRTGNNSSLGLWAGRSQRSGSLPERFINFFPIGLDPYEMIGNPQLRPETNNQLDLTYEIRKENICINIDLFSSWLRDYISSVVNESIKPRLPSSPGVRQFVNIGKAYKTGFETDWKQKLPAGLNHQLSFAFTFGQDLDRHEPLPEIAPADFRYRLYGSYFKSRLNPSLIVRHVLAQNRISKEFAELKTPAFTTCDIEISSRLSKFINLSGGIQNLFDEGYYEHLTRAISGNMAKHLMAPGRSFFISANFCFMNEE